MYRVYHVVDVVRIPPEYFGLPIKEAAKKVLRRKYEGVVDRELGFILAVYNVEVEEEGKIIPGDGATYHIARFDILAFTPILKEVVEGEIVEVTDFGIFVNLGPFDGLIHRSQILDDRMLYDSRRGAYMGQETKRIIEKGDIVRARIVTISTSSSNRIIRIALTMRQPFLGKLEWIQEDLERIYGEKEEKKKAKKK